MPNDREFLFFINASKRHFKAVRNLSYFFCINYDVIQIWILPKELRNLMVNNPDKMESEYGTYLQQT